MDNTQHTPGPWEVSRQEAPIGDGLDWLISGGWETIAVLPDPHDDPTVEANARLIAVAPELLAVLEALLKPTRELCLDSFSDAVPNTTVLAIVNAAEQARATIAKVKGEKEAQ